MGAEVRLLALTSDTKALVEEADRATSRRDLPRALSLLRSASEIDPESFDVHMRLAGVHRALGKPRLALDALHRALATAPLDFTALLLKASLLDQVNDPLAGEAWGNAIAQRPAEPLPSQLAGLLAHGEKKYAAWLAGREKALKNATAAAVSKADADEARRIDRFRSNALRQTRTYHSEPTHYHFPELSEREFHPRSAFPWLSEVESETNVLAAELASVMSAERAELVPYIQYADHLPLDQWKPLNRNPDWTAIHLWKNGRMVERNAVYCPKAMELLERLPMPKINGASPNAMFSLLAPHTAIPPHVGVSNARLVCHLPLIVPDGCWFRVGATTRFWERGNAFVFDDTIEHEALNPTHQLRVVFIFDVWHPDLSGVEKDAVAALIEADGASLQHR